MFASYTSLTGLESVDDEAVKIIVLAVEQQLRTLVKGLLMQRNGYKLRDGKFPHAVGSKIPNPWVLNTQRRLNIGSKRMADVAELLNVDRKTATAAGATGKYLFLKLKAFSFPFSRFDFGLGGGQSGEIDPLVPVGRPTILDAEQREAFEDACAGYNEEAEFLEKRSKLPVSLFDLMRLMKQQKSLIPSHTVYALNMERLISRLHQKGEYSD